MSELKAYVDGSALWDIGIGGYAVVIAPVDDMEVSDKTVFFSAGAEGVTSGTMELTALYEALLWLKDNKKEGATVYSDSKYCTDGYNHHMHIWRMENWSRPLRKKGMRNKRIFLRDAGLWKQVYGISQQMPFKVKWISGHGKYKLHQFADLLACKACNQVKEKRMAIYPKVQVGDSLCFITDRGFIRRFVIMQKYDINSTIILKPLNFKSKPWVMSDREFNNHKFILL